MINHDMLDPNAVLHIVLGPNRVLLRAVCDISPGEQVFYDYYDKRPVDLSFFQYLLWMLEEKEKPLSAK